LVFHCILKKDLFITKARKLEKTKIFLASFRVFIISCFRDYFFFVSAGPGQAL